VNLQIFNIQMAASCWIKTSDSGVSFKTQRNGIDADSLNVLSDGKWHEYKIPVTSDTTSNGLVVAHDATQTYYVDECSIQPMQLEEVSEAHFVGKLTYANTNCSWSSTSTIWSDFPADADCTGSTIEGSISYPSTRIPGVTINNIKTSGYYKVTAQATMGYTTSGSTVCGAKLSANNLNDETQGSSSTYSATADRKGIVQGTFRFDGSNSSETIRIITIRTAGTGSCQILANSGGFPLGFDVQFFPDSSTTIVQQEQRDYDKAGFIQFSSFDMSENNDWLKADGRCVLKADYPDYLANVGISYGECTVSTTNDGMNLPDMRGLFVRTLDDMGTSAGDGGNDPDARTLGDTQNDTIDDHNHGIASNTGYSSGQATLQAATTFQNTAHSRWSGGVAGADTSTETRPVNISLMAYVRMKNTDQVIVGKFKGKKCQTKYLTSDITTDTADITDLKFSSLDIGKSYSAIFMTRGSITNVDQANFELNHNSSVIGGYVASNAGSTIVGFGGSISVRFVASATTLVTSATSVAAGSSLKGNGTSAETWVQLCELPNDIITTTEW
jgi:hypothetical protein